MKLKCRPEDFFVEELAEIRPGPQGPFGLYMLEKRALSTFEAINELARKIGRPPSAISAGGLKDKYALTRQHVTIFGKPVGRLKMRGLRLDPLGRVEKPMTGAELTGNRFAIVLRDLPSGAGKTIAERAELAARQGLPNYFDEQRFGSLRAGEGFIAPALMCLDENDGSLIWKRVLATQTSAFRLSRYPNDDLVLDMARYGNAVTVRRGSVY